MITTFRLVHPRHSPTAFSGEGAFIAGGRWNPPGVRVVYTSSSLALAILEVLAYRKAMKPLTPRHLYRVMLQDKQVTWLSAKALPEDWMAYPHRESPQAIGKDWVNKATSLALAVPSVLVPQEHNFLLNCAHPEFTSLSREGPEEFPLNPRLAPDAATPPKGK